MTKRDRFIISTTILASLLWAPSLFAADKGSQFGIVWGLSVPDADNTNVFHVFGVKGASFFNPQFSLGGYFFVSDKAGQISSSDQFNYSLTGVETAYHMPATAGDTFLAFRMGVTKLQTSPNQTSVIVSPYHYGVAVGYDYYWNGTLSLGFEGSYMHCLPGRTTITGTEYDIPSFNIISFLVSIQVRL